MKSKLTRILFGSALVALLACQAAADGKINGITLKKVGDGVQVQIKGQELTAPVITRVTGGRSFVLEFDASLTTKPRTLDIEQAGVHYVQTVVTQTTPPKVQVQVRVEPDTKLDVSQTDYGFAVKTVKDAPAPAPAPAPTAAPAAAPAASAAPSPAPTSLSVYRQTAHLERAAAPAAAKGKMVSLDFVNTDIVQILKALAMEAGVNIVTSPDVKGALTVSLGNVRVNDALDLITTLDNVHYTQVGNTYIVSGSSNLLSKVSGRTQEASVTRVVALYSGQAPQIKAALKSVEGDVEILLPSEKPVAVASVATVQGTETDVNKTAANNVAAGAAQASQSAQQSNNPNTPKDAYLVLVGPANRVDDMERTVKDIDEQLCLTVGVVYPRTNTIVSTTYHPKGNSAVNLLKAFASSTDATANGGAHAVKGTVEMYATPTGSVSQQTISLRGRETEVNSILESLSNIDTLSAEGADYLIYDVKFGDPAALREDLLQQFPGLSVTIPSGSAGNFNSNMSQNKHQQATERGTSANGEQAAVAGSSSLSGGTGPKGVTIVADDGSKQGLLLPYGDEENFSVPMKLMLRGSKDQIKNAMGYLEAVDVAPKQVALDLRVMELSKEDALRVGLDWSILTGGTVQTFRVNQGVGDTADTPGTFSGRLGFAGGGLANILGTLDDLGNKNKVLARPNLLAIDGRQTEIFVGDVIRYIQSIQSTQNGTTVTTGEVPVGVRLAVLPRIGADGQITMDLRPTVSTLQGFTPVPGGGSLPQTSLRIAQSTMLVHSGETVAIGGLIQDQDSKSRSGIPILKDLPILGWLFGRTNNDHKRTEIVFFLTAKQVSSEDRQQSANPLAHPIPEGAMGPSALKASNKGQKVKVH